MPEVQPQITQCRFVYGEIIKETDTPEIEYRLMTGWNYLRIGGNWAHWDCENESGCVKFIKKVKQQLKKLGLSKKKHKYWG